MLQEVFDGVGSGAGPAGGVKSCAAVIFFEVDWEHRQEVLHEGEVAALGGPMKGVFVVFRCLGVAVHGRGKDGGEGATGEEEVGGGEGVEVGDDIVEELDRDGEEVWHD